MKIQFVRIAQPVTVHCGGSVRIEEQAKTVAVSFAADDGRVISLAFDGRCSKTPEGFDHRVREEYAPYGDCPVYNGDGQTCGPVSDLQTARFLRDALIALDLGEYDDKRVCAECEKPFVPAHYSNYVICPTCQE